jgi:hypothetical protein
MNISYTLPLSKAWTRMKKALFQPFDLHKWMILGFTAFLAGLGDFNGGNNGNNVGKHGSPHWDEFFRFPQTAWDWLTSHPLWFNLIILGIIVLVLIITVFMWLNARGKFMFLHNVANDAADIGKPWHEYRKEGNSLFVWNFFFGWFVVAAVILMFVHFFVKGKNLYYGDYPTIVLFWQIAGMIAGFLLLMVVVGYIKLFLNDFVVPVMYKDRTGVWSGWYTFMMLFFRHPFSFIVYGLFIFLLGIATVIAVVFFALCTCCIGLVLLIIPYIGSVVLLPVSYTFRALSIEFFAQFGDDYNVFPLPLA